VLIGLVGFALPLVLMFYSGMFMHGDGRTCFVTR